ncbi:MAG: HD-GYP domain-containing protein [Alphaproteobacteria bacterium]
MAIKCMTVEGYPRYYHLMASEHAQSVKALQLALESRDLYTGQHSTKVAEISRAIGTRLGLSPERQNALYLVGLVHDIGKIRIPTEILTRPGTLNEPEWMLIKSHPQVGHDILRPLETSWPLAEIVLQHHERLDGNGYPRGLRGNDILLEARILSVADMVDSMARHRPYRPALSRDACIGEIAADKGVRYDAAAVDACVSLLKEGWAFGI